MICSGIYSGRIYSVNPNNIMCPTGDICGVYGISGVLQNISNDSSLYVGSSYDIASRFDRHLSTLKNQYHHCSHLQNSFNKYGEKNFVLILLEECYPSDRLDREQNWTDYYNYNFPDHKPLFNQREEVRKLPTSIRKCKEYIVEYPDGSEEYCQNLVRFCKKHNLRRASLAKTVTGTQNKHRGFRARYVSDPSFRYVDNTWKLKFNQKAIEASKKFTTNEYWVTYPNKEKIKIRNLKMFCQKNNINYQGARAVVSKKLEFYKGFKFERIGEKKRNYECYSRDFSSKEYKIITPDKQEIKIKNLSKFAKDNRLSYPCLLAVANGRYNQHKGFIVCHT